MKPMISSEMISALNQQVTNEFGASHQYLAMACSFENQGFKVLAGRFYAQAQEEREHAMKLAKFILDVGGEVTLDAIPKPGGDFSSPLAIFKAALQAELEVTEQINKLVALADKEKDYASRGLLQWYVDEQVEEVSSMSDLVNLAERARDPFQIEIVIRHTMSS